MAHLKKAVTGHLLKNSNGHLVLECPATPCLSCAELDALSNWRAEDYRIAGYSDGDLSACASCRDTPWLPAWDGSFTRSEDTFGRCSMAAWLPHRSIDGKWLRLGETRVGYSTLSCEWYLQVACNAASMDHPFYYDIWHGVKADGLTPIGTYTRVDGNDLTPTLDIEEVP